MKKMIISILLTLLLTGCFNYKELNEYSIVTGIAIDKKDNKYELSLLISNSPKNSSDNSKKETQIVVYSGLGDTIFEALKDVELISPKEIYLGHFSILVIGEDVAKEGVNNILDFFLRDTNAKKNFYIAIAKNCKAKDTLKIITPLADFPSQNISDNLISTNKLQGIISNMNFNKFLSNIKRNGIEAVLNTIEIIGNEDKGFSNKNIETSEPKTYLKLAPLAIFKSDKIVNFATDLESIGINIINNKTNEMYITVKYNDSDIIINTNSFKTKVTIDIKDNIPIVNINASCEAKIVEINNNININDDKVLKEINSLANKELKKYINKGISLAKKNNTDIFGFNLKLYQNYPKYYKNNKNININDFKYNIKTNLNLRSKGSATTSLEDYNEEN